MHSEAKAFQLPGESFCVGVISDTQLPPTKKQLRENDIYVQNLRKALRVLKARSADVILFAGDIGDLGTRFAFRTYAQTFTEVFGVQEPIVQTILGNHDYWNKSLFSAISHRRAFRQILGQSPWTHYVINGYHFIGASPDCGSMTAGYRRVAKWLDRELAEAQKESAGKPIFVMTHNQPVNTSYGSEDWGDTTLDAVLRKYPTVINFSGHVHYSLLDERSVWQGAYTVINTQSLSYTELEPGKVNGTIPPHADDTPMGYLLEIGPQKIQVHRLNFADGKHGYEEKPDARWVFPLPYQNDGRYAFEPRRAKNQPPRFSETAGSAKVRGDELILSFPAAQDDDFVHSYKVVTDGQEPLLFFSDFYNGLTQMQKTVTLALPAPKPGTHCVYRVYAVDSWGRESENFVKIVFTR